ncbi:hypothetical protein R5W24_004187 [Gemmata sp. JC717]|uniref:hypothetical protein n=1 Tax=Gemmata algarum TaxID=2975278 RepID=UPI0021BAE6B8|nr:hypothetical protein [Gemmata algarum]MDY3555052.1 hypothetical protein [Gemmata algarum]
MRTTFLLAAVFLACSSGSADDGKQAPRKAAPPAGYDPMCFLGRVESVCADGVVIKPQGDMRIRGCSFHTDGTPHSEYLFVQDNTQPARAFGYEDSLRMFCGLPLTHGLRPGLGHSTHSGEHKITDVLVGDVVLASYRQQRGEWVCTAIRIQRRPGGRVPEAVGDKDTTIGRKVVTRMNAEQFVEETIAGKWAPRLLAGLRK